MDSQEREICRTVSAKLPAETATALERIAEYRGVTRSYLIRELAEAAAEGRVIFKPPPSGRPRARTHWLDYLFTLPSARDGIASVTPTTC